MTEFSLKFDESTPKADGEAPAIITLIGNQIDLINLVACACDKKEVREILRAAIALDKLHDEIVGRRFDENL